MPDLSGFIRRARLQNRSGHLLGTTVYEAMREALRNGEYRPGDRLREEEIAQRLNVSRTPVREALGRLQARRLVENAGGRGLVVRQLELRDVMDLYAMREIIEGAAARLAADHASEFELQSLTDLNETFARHLDEPQELARLNRLFHEGIYRAARNSYLDLTLGEIQDAIGTLRSTTFAISERPESAVEEHAGIIDAIARRDQSDAEERARAHIRNALRARLRLLQGT